MTQPGAAQARVLRALEAVRDPELDEPITPVGALTRATASVIGSLKRLRRAALRRDAGASPSPA